MDQAPTPVGKQEHAECPQCGETLIRVNATGDPAEDFIEAASRTEHACWTTLPEGSEHLRMKE